MSWFGSGVAGGCGRGLGTGDWKGGSDTIVASSLLNSVEKSREEEKTDASCQESFLQNLTMLASPHRQNMTVWTIVDLHNDSLTDCGLR